MSSRGSGVAVLSCNRSRLKKARQENSLNSGMKSLLHIVACAFLFISLSVLGQGQLSFSNIGVGFRAPVTDWDGTNKLWGTAFAADLWFGAANTTDSSSLFPLNQPTFFATNGFFVGGVRTIPFMGTAGWPTITVQVRVWDVPDGDPFPPNWANWNGNFATARAAASALFQVTLTSLPYPPANMTNMPPFQLWPLALSPIRGPLGVTMNSLENGNLLFTWPGFYEAWTYALQENADLNTTNWRTLPNAPGFVGASNLLEYQILLSPPQRTTFYRLVQPFP